MEDKIAQAELASILHKTWALVGIAKGSTFLNVSLHFSRDKLQLIGSS